jgi:hypothetical protein
VDAAEVVVREVQPERCRVVLQLLGEGIGQAGEAADAHPHGQVGALDVAGRDVLGIGATLDERLRRASADSRGVAVISLRALAVVLDQLREVHAPAEGILDRLEVHLVAVAGELDPVHHPGGNSGEGLRRLGAPETMR